MRHTKIIATVGPAIDSDAVLDGLIAAGADIIRLNFSHATHESHAAMFARVRAAAKRVGREVAVLQDLGGPKIRTGRLEGGRPIALEAGQAFTIATGDFIGGQGRVSTTFEGLASGVRAGDRLLLADGSIELKVEGTDGAEVLTTVVEGGSLGQHKGINAPGVELAAMAMTPKDVEDLKFGLSLGVDMVALSFVRSAADLRRARLLMTSAGADDVPLVAKLERPEAIEHLSDILECCDAVMVARGDLGLEMPLERVPRIQKDVIRRARRRGIPVIVATQVLESMTHEVRPTRAEVSDAANAVAEGVDAIMLAAETAAGAYPVRAVQMLDAIIREAELDQGDDGPAARRATDDHDHDHVRALCAAAVTLAERSDARAIVAVTRGGSTARQLSTLRPRAPIVAATNRVDTARRLLLHWGVAPLCIESRDAADMRPEAIIDHLLANRLAKSGDPAVFININPDLSLRDANFLRIQRL
jgi:pyruvate kinase